jgi:hypothetical protein
MEDHAMAYGTWGRVGVWHILARLKECGISRVYWRSMGDGQSSYHSRLTENKSHFYPDEFPASYSPGPEQVDYVNKVMNFDEIDMFKCARQRARELGMEFIVWHEARGEDHGHLLYSQFVKKYPRFLSIRDDGKRAYSELGWAFPEVMDRRIGLFREVIGYEPDGVYFDFVKSGDDVVSRLGEDGYWRMGYEEPMVEGFKKKTNRDPYSIANNDKEWLACRAGYVSEYLRRCRKIRDTFYPDVELGLFAVQPKYSASHMGVEEERRLAYYPEDSLANLEDHDTWISERLIETYTIGHNCRCEFNVLETVEDQITMAKTRLEGRIKFNLQVETYTNRENNAKQWLEKLIEIAEREKIEEIILRESCPMWAYNNMWRAIKEMSK